MATPQAKTKGKDKEAFSRPYRIWDSNGKCDVRYRYYTHSKRAHMGALIECKWAKPETVYEVYNVNTGKVLGQYKRMISSVVFLK